MDQVFFDSSEIEKKVMSERLIQEIKVFHDGEVQDYVIIKRPPISTIDAPNREKIRQIWLFQEFRDCKPEEYYQYTVLTREKCDGLLRRANELSPTVSLSMPMYPNSLDQVDEYSISRVNHLLSGGHDITVYFHPHKRHFFIPSQDVMTPKTRDLIRACEIISVAHHFPMFPIIHFNNFARYEFDSVSGKYVVYDMNVSGNKRIIDEIDGRDGVLLSNSSYYTKTQGSKN